MTARDLLRSSIVTPSLFPAARTNGTATGATADLINYDGAMIAVSFGAFAFLPAVLGLAVPLLSLHALRLSVTLALLIASMTYLLLTWVWLIARLLDDLLGGTPRGGHPAATS